MIHTEEGLESSATELIFSDLKKKKMGCYYSVLMSTSMSKHSDERDQRGKRSICGAHFLMGPDDALPY
jgi:hypothetical protein